MHLNHQKIAMKGMFAAAVISAAGGALGVAPARAAGETAEVEGIAEIVVTAQKRSESLQSVPVSVTALTGGQLAQLKIDTPTDLVAQVPNLQVNGIVGEGS